MLNRIFNCQKARRTDTSRRPDIATSSKCKQNMRPEVIEKNAHVPSDAESQILLTALHNLIVPLVKNVVPNATSIGEFTMGAEAEDLLVALQKYVASVIGGRIRPNTQNEGPITKIVSLEAQNAPELVAMHYEAVPQDVADEPRYLYVLEKRFLRSDISIRDSNETLNAMLDRLRKRVFNRMPIRLLYFERCPKSGSLEISLLNRAEVYKILAKKLAIKFLSMSEDSSDDSPLSISVTCYAVLSHTWLRSGSDELTYDDWCGRTFDMTHPGFCKLVRFCQAAMDNHGLSLGWMDTVCIAKSSSSELDESIRSMYEWYRNASICIAYLAETTSLSNMEHDPWFTRGWTLQELLAPARVKFYGRIWNQLVASPNDKKDEDIQQRVKLATSITKDELTATYRNAFPISRRMQWAANRQVTREEDIAYSLMGIFGVSMPIAYGEGGDIAFARLVREILNTTRDNVLDIFNWGGDYETAFSFLLPSSPQAYSYRDDNLDALPSRLMKPLTLTPMGLRVPVLILPVTLTDIPVPEYTPKGDFFASASTDHAEGYVFPLRMKRNIALILDVNAFDPVISTKIRRYALAVLNCTGTGLNIIVPVQCFAIGFSYFNVETMPTPFVLKQKVLSNRPITFQLRNKFIVPNEDDNYILKRDELEHHGMQYLNMYF